LPGDLGEPNRRVAELNHGGEVRVTAVSHTENVCWKGKRAGNVAAGTDVADRAPTSFDHGNVGLVVAKEVREALLAERVEATVGPQDGCQVMGGESGSGFPVTETRM